MFAGSSLGAAPEPDPIRVLAVAVIRQALKDLSDGRRPVRDAALHFLQGSEGLRFWVDVARLDFPAVRLALGRWLAERGIEKALDTDEDNALQCSHDNEATGELQT